MAFKASNVIPTRAYENAKAEALRIKLYFTGVANSLSSDVDADQILRVAQVSSNHLSRLNEISSTPGIVAYAQAQEGDENYDVAAEFVTLVNAVTTVRNWIINALPDNGTYLLIHEVNQDGTLTARTFTPAQTSQLLTLVNTVINSVE